MSLPANRRSYVEEVLFGVNITGRRDGIIIILILLFGNNNGFEVVLSL